MPTVKIPKGSLEGPSRVPPGIYSVRFDGFNPKFTKKRDSYNLLPDLKIVNNPEFHDRKAGGIEWLNSNAGWVIRDFCHCFGVLVGGTPDDPELPGEFTPPDEPDPTKWRYQGELLGRVGQVELAEVVVEADPAIGRRGGTFVNIKRYLCAIPGCQEKHSDNLLG